MSEDVFDNDWLARREGFESPIEMKLHRYLCEFFDAKTIEKQKWIGKYRVDLFIPPRFVIEADGRAFHNLADDALRDSDPCFADMVVIRCSGKLIHFHPKRVARRIKEIVGMHDRGVVRGGWHIWHLYHEDQIPLIGDRA